MIDIAATLKDVEWNKEEPAGQKQVLELITNAVIGLPVEYIAFLLFSNGGEGPLGINPGWFHYGLPKK